MTLGPEKCSISMWTHPVTGRNCRCQIMVDVCPRSPIVTVFEESTSKITSNNSSEDCRKSLVKDWMAHRSRPKLLRLDPDGAYVSNNMLETISGLHLDVAVTPPEAP